ncbi:MAG: glycoside hydrolase family 3 N-terminal domain-containing protein [Micrococcales bacterium]
MGDFRDPTLPVFERVEDLLQQMTLAEKIGQMLQLDARQGLERLIDEFHVGSVLHTSPEQLVKSAEYVAKTRLRIPLLVADDAIHGHSFWEGATIYPTQLGMACSWDTCLVEKAARQAAREISATGLHWTFSPVLCIARDLRWGRVGETFGEDPFLIGEMASAMVRGYQGDGLQDKSAVLATAKHFAGYSETQGGRDASEADLSQRKLRSWFLPPFERVAREGCRTFMLGYQSIDGVPITANKWLLNDVLKGEWGFTGTLVTDWDNVGRMVWEQKTSPDMKHAAALAVEAGNDLVMTTWQFFDGALEAVADGLLKESQINDAVRRILTLKFELGLFEEPRLPNADQQSLVIGHKDHEETNLALALGSMVLLKNDGLLPLEPTKPDYKIAVIGPNADDAQNQLGDWAGNSGQINWMPDGQPREMISTVLDGLRSECPDNWKVSYTRGANIGELRDDPRGGTLQDGQPRPKILSPSETDTALLSEAIENAADADVVVAVVGDCIELAGELRSTATLELVGGQLELLEQLAALGKPMLVIVLSTKPLVLPDSVLKSNAIIQTFSPGMKGGIAVARIILGKEEPTGRLPITIARHVGQQPSFYNQVRGQHGDRYADLSQKPAFPFGFGLSYSTVNYTDLEIEKTELSVKETVRANVTLQNVGSRHVRETVQVYVHDEIASVTWAEKELKSFKKVLLAPGETKTVLLELPVASCSLVTADGKRVVEPGAFQLLVGPNSDEASLLRAAFSVRP